MSVVNFLISAAVGVAAGVLTGVGVGGGTALMIYLTTLGGLGAQTAKGINLLYFFPCSACSLFFHFRGGFVEKRLVLPAVLSGVVCAGISAWLSTFIPTEIFSKIFGVFLLYVGIREVFSRK